MKSKYYGKKSVITCSFFKWGIQQGPISKFWYTSYANNVSYTTSIYGSNEDSQGGKSEIWPFLTFKVAFSKFSFWWLKKHYNGHISCFGQNVVCPSCLAKSGWTVSWRGGRAPSEGMYYILCTAVCTLPLRCYSFFYCPLSKLGTLLFPRKILLANSIFAHLCNKKTQ